MKKTIYAVVWVDFGILLSLPAESNEAAIMKAQLMHDRARAAGLMLRGLRAVVLDGDDNLLTLWELDNAV